MDKIIKIDDIDRNMNDQNIISTVEWKYKQRVFLLSNFHNSTNVSDVKRKSKYRTTIVYFLGVRKDYETQTESINLVKIKRSTAFLEKFASEYHKF